MNRLLSLLVVLVVGSGVSAMDIYPWPIPTGELGSVTNPAFPSDEIVVFVHSDKALVGLDVYLEVVSGPATIVGALDIATAASYGWDPGFTYNPSIAADGKWAEICAGDFGGVGPGIVGYFALHGEGGGEISLRLLAGYRCGGSMDWIYEEPTTGGEIVVYQAPAPTCWDANECAGQPYGDATCDGIINLADLYALRAAFIKDPPWLGSECCADFNHDFCVCLGDLFIIKQYFNTGGYSPSTGNQNCP